jgi:GT2 family glycosyltransferase
MKRPPAQVRFLPGALTVIIPNLNHCAYLSISIGSVLRQSKPPFRVLVLDDGSNDGSVELVQRYAEAHPSVELMINPRRLHVNGAVNRGLSLTQTEYVTMLAADDFVDERLYEIALNCLRVHPNAAFCATDVHWIDEAGELLAQPADPTIVRVPDYLSPERSIKLLSSYGSFLSGNGCVFRTALLQAAGGFDPSFGSYADNLAQQTLAAKHGLCYVPGRFAYWRRTADSFSSQTNRSYQAHLKILKAVEERIATDPERLFPPTYSNKLLRRLRFDAARAAITSEPPRVPDAAALMPSLSTKLLLRLVASRFGINVSIFAMLIFLRPFDLIFAVRRRLKLTRFFGCHLTQETRTK